MLLDRGPGRGARGTGAIVEADVEGRVETEEERAGPRRRMGTEAEGAGGTEEMAAGLQQPPPREGRQSTQERPSFTHRHLLHFPSRLNDNTPSHAWNTSVTDPSSAV